MCASYFCLFSSRDHLIISNFECALQLSMEPGPGAVHRADERFAAAGHRLVQSEAAPAVRERRRRRGPRQLARPGDAPERHGERGLRPAFRRDDSRVLGAVHGGSPPPCRAKTSQGACCASLYSGSVVIIRCDYSLCASLRVCHNCYY